MGQVVLPSYHTVIDARSYNYAELLDIYNQSIIDLVPKERLLVMDIEDGWEPLCRFLDKEIPDESFPRVNEAEANAAFGRRIMVKLILIWLGYISLATLATFTLFRLIS